MKTDSWIKRALLVTSAIAVAAFLLRGQLSSALVTRGDTLAYWGRHAEARQMYARALFFDPGNGIATDRFAFDAVISNDPPAILDCLVVAGKYLTQSPKDGSVLFDRALCYQHERELRKAADDFYLAAEIRRDARAMMFAALDERRLKQEQRARELLREAERFEPQFLPVRQALARS